MSTWLITGCSTGLGRALAEAVIGAGHNAVVTARDAAAAVESPEPPAFLLLGPDALAAYRYKADARAAEIQKWEELTSSTDFEG